MSYIILYKSGYHVLYYINNNNNRYFPECTSLKDVYLIITIIYLYNFLDNYKGF